MSTELRKPQLKAQVVHAAQQPRPVAPALPHPEFPSSGHCVYLGQFEAAHYATYSDTYLIRADPGCGWVLHWARHHVATQTGALADWIRERLRTVEV